MGSAIIIEFITFYLLFWWVMSILYTTTFRIQARIEKIGHYFKAKSFVSNFILDLSECLFCIENHIATIGAISYSYYCLDYKYLIWGLLCASINSWIRTFLKM